MVELFASDVDRIINLYDGKFSDGWNREMLLSAFNGGRFHAFGIEKEGALIGFIGVTLSADFADIESVFVDGDFRNKGVGKRLVDGAISFIKESGLDKILLEVKANNASAIALYEKCGFSRLGVRKKYYADGADALIMVKVGQ